MSGRIRPATQATLVAQVRDWAKHSADAIHVRQEIQDPDLDRLAYLRGTLAACNAVLEYLGEEKVPEPPPPAPRPWADGIEQYQVESR